MVGFVFLTQNMGMNKKCQNFLDHKTVANNLKELMKKNQMTRRDFAHVVGVSVGSVNTWLAGKRFPTVASLIAIANYFQLKFDSLLC